MPLAFHAATPQGTYRTVHAAYGRSASQLSLVLDMLASLDVLDRHRVLEIGTGTGYNATILTARLGDHAVTTIEIDATGTNEERWTWLDHPDQHVSTARTSSW